MNKQEISKQKMQKMNKTIISNFCFTAGSLQAFRVRFLSLSAGDLWSLRVFQAEIKLKSSLFGLW